MRTISYIALVFTLLTSCTEIIDIDLADQPETRLVVNGKVMHYVNDPDSSYQEIILTKSRSYFDNVEDDYSVSGAVVKVTNLNTDEEVLFQESTDVKGLYFTNSLKGIVGHTYKLNIEATLDGELQTFEGVDNIPFESPNIDSIILVKEENLFGDGEKVIYETTINFFNNPRNEYFKFETFINNYKVIPENDNPNFFFNLIDDAFLGDTITEYQVTDFRINDGDNALIAPPFYITINMQNINQSAYNYWRKLYVNNVANTDTPQTEVRGNINNLNYEDRYALGVFMCGSQSSRKQLITEFPKE